MIYIGIMVLVGGVFLETYFGEFQTDFGSDGLKMTISETTFIMIPP
jgi:hypothetical protein